MTRKLVGREAFAIAAGLLLFTAGPLRAAPASDGDASVEQTAQADKPLALTKANTSRIHKASHSRKATKAAALKAEKKAKLVKTAKAAVSETPMPDAVANANAQMPAIDARGAAAVNGMPPLEVAAAEQLSELDKSLTAPLADAPRQMAQLTTTDEAQTTLTLAAPEPTRPLKEARISSSNDAWAQSSLIGKIFIAFGGMLTLASAARMLVA